MRWLSVLLEITWYKYLLYINITIWYTYSKCYTIPKKIRKIHNNNGKYWKYQVLYYFDENQVLSYFDENQDYYVKSLHIIS